MNIFHGWKDAAEMVSDFEIDPAKLDGAEILFAGYDQGGYEGHAFVLLRRNGKLYEVNGGHCSCYGLEGMWDEEETSPEAIRVRLDADSYDLRPFADEVRRVISQ
jgi:hypothetical protein